MPPRKKMLYILKLNSSMWIERFKGGLNPLFSRDIVLEVCYPTRARQVPKYFRVSDRVRVNV